MEPGRKVEVKVIRDQENLTLFVVLGDLNSSTKNGSNSIKNLRGLELQELNAELREKASIPEGIQGIFVKTVAPDSPFHRVFRTGIVVLEANGVKVETSEEFRENLQTGINRFYIWFRGNFAYVGVRILEEKSD
jgi:S1-C subfamily serine protease